MNEYVDDKNLAISLRNSDKEAFREVFDRYHRKVYQFAYSFLKDSAQSEDVVQEAFLQFWLYRQNLAVDVPIAPLLFTMTRRVILNYWRKCATSDKFRQQLLQAFEQASNDTEAYVVSRDIERISEEALQLLTEQQRTIFLLSREEGLTYAEIAEQLHISRNTVKYHLTNALNTFRQHFAKYGILYSYFVLFYFADL
ncbi:RNA polymerase sigma-70 factor [Sphingobacterium sp. SGG-5]|uniref:RNA polymerase sigma factor n=1 Tax=Sphingobacterium sp. SGG-5 TaxID=2710881 RepID=UPI0013EB800E|nr:RNA polymerase sigma-70 factor [Sphingobacterium sp. SGG-5]NGM60821.1 RNA polymerase sigma-70 factor [Sphingobacterium sp. SGG-5]